MENVHLDCGVSPVSESHGFSPSRDGGLEEGVEGAVDSVAPTAHDDDIEERVIRRLRDLQRSAAGAGLGGRPPERPHSPLPFPGAAAPWRCSRRIIQRSPLERGTQWIW